MLNTVHTSARAGFPSGPASSALLQTFRWVTRPTAFLDELVVRHGDPFTLRYVTGERFVLSGRPELIKQILVDEAAQPGCLVANEELRPFLGDGSLLMLNGEEHRRHRRFFRHPFAPKQLLGHVDMICSLTDRMTGQLVLGQTFAAYPLIQALSMEIILRVVVDSETPERFAHLRAACVAAMESISAPFLFFPFLQRDLGKWSPGGKVNAARRVIDEMIFSEVARRRSGACSGSNDVLTSLAQADESGLTLTDAEIRDEVMTLLAAGHEPTTAAVSWALYWLHKHPQVAARLHDELDANPNLERAGAGTYLDAVCRETLRISPIILALSRRYAHAIDFDGYTIAPGTYLSACSYLAHRRSAVYPEPERFVPQRFLERSFSPYEFVPFGVGARQCLGMAFALQQMRIVLARLLRRYRFVLGDESQVVTPATRGAVVRPSPNLQLKVVEVKRP
jgi:cytochrome P450 family 110